MNCLQWKMEKKQHEPVENQFSIVLLNHVVELKLFDNLHCLCHPKGHSMSMTEIAQHLKIDEYMKMIVLMILLVLPCSLVP